MKYEALDWASLDYLKTHLYRRLANPLVKTLETLEKLQNMGDSGKDKLQQTHHLTEALLNTVNAWATLINYKQNGMLNTFQYKAFSRAALPGWFKLYLEQHINLRVDFDKTIEVHHETFLEALILLYQVAQSISQVAYIQLTDALAPRDGVYMRIVFMRQDVSNFSSLSEIQDHFDLENVAEADLALQFAVARDLMTLNRAKFNLQNNRKTGQQALTAFFAAIPEPAAAEVKPYHTNQVHEPTPVLIEPSQSEPKQGLPPQADKLSLPDALAAIAHMLEEDPTDLEALPLGKLDSPMGGEQTSDQKAAGSPKTSFSW